jgi:hypothetical protein
MLIRIAAVSAQKSVTVVTRTQELTDRRIVNYDEDIHVLRELVENGGKLGEFKLECLELCAHPPARVLERFDQF